MASKPNDGGPAFPRRHPHYKDLDYGGVSTRTYLAGQAVSGALTAVADSR